MTSNKKTGIYIIKNVINNKVYMGQSVNILWRFWVHKNSLRLGNHYNEVLQRAWNKDGEENFIFEIVELCSKEDLDSCEKRWIEYYDCVPPNGYNLTSGGRNGYKHREVDGLGSGTTISRAWKNFSSDKKAEIGKKVSDTFNKNKEERLKLLESIDFIPLYQSEFNEIWKIRNYKCQVFLFSAIVFTKIFYPHLESFIINDRDIKRMLVMSGLHMNRLGFFKDIYPILEEFGICYINKKDFSIIINIPFGKGKIFEKIYDFSNLYNVYKLIIGGEFYCCRNCGVEIKRVDGKKRKTYCKECAKSVKREQVKLAVRKIREMKRNNKKYE